MWSCSSVVVLLDFPDGNRIDDRWNGAINTASEGTQRRAIGSDHREPPRIVVAWPAKGVGFDKHVDDSRKVGRRPLVSSLLVHRQRAGRIERRAQTFKLGFRTIHVHQTRRDVLVEHIRPVLQIVDERPSSRGRSVASDEVRRSKAQPAVGHLNVRDRRRPHHVLARQCVTHGLADGSHIGPERLGQMSKLGVCLHQLRPKRATKRPA